MEVDEYVALLAAWRAAEREKAAQGSIPAIRVAQPWKGAPKDQTRRWVEQQRQIAERRQEAIEDIEKQHDRMSLDLHDRRGRRFVADLPSCEWMIATVRRQLHRIQGQRRLPFVGLRVRLTCQVHGRSWGEPTSHAPLSDQFAVDFRLSTRSGPLLDEATFYRRGPTEWECFVGRFSADAASAVVQQRNQHFLNLTVADLETAQEVLRRTKSHLLSADVWDYEADRSHSGTMLMGAIHSRGGREPIPPVEQYTSPRLTRLTTTAARAQWSHVTRRLTPRGKSSGAVASGTGPQPRSHGRAGCRSHHRSQYAQEDER